MDPRSHKSDSKANTIGNVKQKEGRFMFKFSGVYFFFLESN